MLVRETCECFQNYFSVLDLRAERHVPNLSRSVIVFILVLQILFTSNPACKLNLHC